MIGWAGESGRMDNTIRYSNAGIATSSTARAFLFTDLMPYDAKYYKGTDAAAFYDGWGDIVGGIGSYPVLGNPNYHQPTDFIETINFRQIAETAKVTAATLIYLASSPSRLNDLKADAAAAGVTLTWTPSPEAGVQVVRRRLRTGGGSAADAHHRDDGEGDAAGAAGGHAHRRQGRERARPRRLGLGANRRTVSQSRRANLMAFDDLPLERSDSPPPGPIVPRLRRPRRRRGGLCWARRRSSLARD